MVLTNVCLGQMTATLGKTIDTRFLDIEDGPARFGGESELNPGYLEDSTIYWQLTLVYLLHGNMRSKKEWSRFDE